MQVVANAASLDSAASASFSADAFWPAPAGALPAPFRVAFTTRAGGVSVAPHDSLNLALHVGDNPRCVRDNRARVFGGLGLDPARAVVAQQIHGAFAVEVTADDAGRGSFSHADTIEGADALVTRDVGLPLVCFNADCVLLALGDPDARILGLLHAGWRGMAAGIIENTVALMRECGANPARIHAVGSPSIGPCCFEVGEEVVAALGTQHVVSRPAPEKAMYDFRAAARQRLLHAGLKNEMIQTDPACTCCESRFFSHRRATRQNSGGTGRTGRMAMVAWME